jgi:alpha-tubulin suppressor-like RCC1 family protein
VSKAWTWALLALGFAATLGACNRFRPPQETNRPPFVRVQLVVAQNLPTDRVGSADLVFAAAGEEPLPLTSDTGFAEINGIQVISKTQLEPGSTTRKQLLVSFATNPFTRPGQRTVELFLYPTFLADAGLTPPAVLRARLLTVDGRVLARGETTVDSEGKPIQFGERDRTVQVIAECVPDGPCGEPVIPVDAKITVTRAADCPSSNLTGKLFAILFPTGPNAGRGQLYGSLASADFSDASASHTVTVPAPPGLYALIAVLDVGGDLPLTNLSPQRGDLTSVLQPFSIFRDRVSETQVQLETIVEVGSCIGGRTLLPPILSTTLPPSPGNTTQPLLFGTAAPLATVRVFEGVGCQGTPVAETLSDDAGQFVAQITAAPNTTTLYSSNVTTLDGETSACSPRELSYLHDGIPPTMAGTSFLPATFPTWTPGSDPGGSPREKISYEVCVAPSPSTACESVLLRTAPGVTQATFVDPFPNQRQDIYVRAVDEAGNRSGPLVGTLRSASSFPLIREIAVRDSRTCALVGGLARCVGRDAAGTASTETIELRPGFRSLALGGTHTCVLSPEGEVLCWGGNAGGQLGDGTTTRRATPVRVRLPQPATQVAAGGTYTCALLVDGTARCWGQNDAGQLANPATMSSSTPVAVLSSFPPQESVVSSITAIAAGEKHTCALAESDSISGYAQCWGEGAEFKLPNTFSTTNQPLPQSGTFSTTGFVMGEGHTCLLNSTGNLLCWGRNGEGQLGDGTTATDGSQHSPNFGQRIAIRIRQASGGKRTTCAVDQSGTVHCWGANDRGQVGIGAQGTPELVPRAVVGLPEPAVQVATSGEHSCALGASGTAYCWGANDAGQSDGRVASATPQVTPKAFEVGSSSALTGVDITAGGSHACARLTSGGVVCWGRNDSGQLGDGTLISRSVPAPVLGFELSEPGASTTALRTAGAIAASAGADSTCIVDAQGRARCFGAGSEGQLGDGTSSRTLAPGVAIGGARVAVSVGNQTVCAATAAGSVDCWGYNEFGQVAADPPPTAVLQPSFVSNVGGVRVVAVGGSHACSLSEDGAIYCWGQNSAGQLGNGSTTTISTPQRAQTNLVAGVAAGGAHTCAVSVSGEVSCWGTNDFGQLGDGTMAASNTPRTIAGLSRVRRVVAGKTHTCALDARGLVSCWGQNSRGQLGNASRTFSTTPFNVALGGATAIAAGDEFTCTLDLEGNAHCFGANDFGQIGARGIADSLTPRRVEAFP